MKYSEENNLCDTLFKLPVVYKKNPLLFFNKEIVKWTIRQWRDLINFCFCPVALVAIFLYPNANAERALCELQIFFSAERKRHLESRRDKWQSNIIIGRNERNDEAAAAVTQGREIAIFFWLKMNVTCSLDIFLFFKCSSNDL